MSAALSFKPAPMERPFHRHSNSAGAPLPRIPKRSVSASAVRTPPSTPAATTLQSMFIPPASPAKTPTPPTALVVQPPTPPRAPPAAALARQHSHQQAEASGSGSSSSSDAPVQFSPRSRRTRPSLSVSLRPPEESTPTPSVLHAQKGESEQVAWPLRSSAGSAEFDTPRASASTSKSGSKLRPAGSTKTLSVPEFPTEVRGEHTPRAMSVSIPASITTQFARKKSGEPLKSSLKSRRARVHPDLAVITGGTSTKSEPSTPTHIKSVHFDAQLEHVKLFLAEQKPLAVSRDGSPTTDTSGTESDFPAFIYGGVAEPRGRLVMRTTDMPAEGSRPNADVALERLELSADGTSVNGRVRVRNLAFEKWVAVRFTLDWWQTTSEVTARYVQTCPGGGADIFAFVIRLHDMLARIEEKTMFIAVRYTVGGREIWDNNGGKNYQVSFTREALPPKQQQQEKDNDESDAEVAGMAGMADLKSKLERVATGRETVGGYLSCKSSSPSPHGESFSLHANTPLASRYDFTASLRSPWRPGTASPPAHAHARNSTYPHALPPLPFRPGKLPSPAYATRGSPRIVDPDDDAAPAAFYAGSDSEDTPGPAGVPPAVFSRRRARHHQRGYYDIGLALNGGGAAKKTLPGLFAEAALRYTADAAQKAQKAGLAEALPLEWSLERGGSEESTPPFTSTSESSSPSSSPFDESMLFKFMAARNGNRADSPVNDPSYNVFLNRFCFYTGSESLLDVPSDVLQRSHSASSVEELLSSPNPNHLSPSATPTRSSSFDDIARMSDIHSGSSTPTARSMVEAESATPVSLAY
ncbi:carbohydrate-binding module family 21 protein [Wolfiporia cocos MD-104 SS10]|uniref:Carbohydrate-binding module family 21 protein n=1 Tax=Wolfiporia cocos (strain MD-104) TaxID=742152 RepID=A0A2H3JLH8_WOLCO|nr:carbohydrate-binding module family 21 protein [Wolfiporia cocos MD-104 SS10]